MDFCERVREVAKQAKKSKSSVQSTEEIVVKSESTAAPAAAAPADAAPEGATSSDTADAGSQEISYARFVEVIKTSLEDDLGHLREDSPQVETALDSALHALHMLWHRLDREGM